MVIVIELFGRKVKAEKNDQCHLEWNQKALIECGNFFNGRRMITGIFFNGVRSCAAAYSCGNGGVGRVAHRCFQNAPYNPSHRTTPSTLSSAQLLPNIDPRIVGILKPPKSSPDKGGLAVPTWNAAVYHTQQGKEILFPTASNKKM